MSVLAVIVLYKRSVDRSQTLISLGEAFGRHPELPKFLRVLLWDNSPTPTTPSLAFPFDYFHSGKMSALPAPSIAPWNLRRQWQSPGCCSWIKTQSFLNNS